MKQQSWNQKQQQSWNQKQTCATFEPSDSNDQKAHEQQVSQTTTTNAPRDQLSTEISGLRSQLFELKSDLQSVFDLGSNLSKRLTKSRENLERLLGCVDEERSSIKTSASAADSQIDETLIDQVLNDCATTVDPHSKRKGRQETPLDVYLVTRKQKVLQLERMIRDPTLNAVKRRRLGAQLSAYRNRI